MKRFVALAKGAYPLLVVVIILAAQALPAVILVALIVTALGAPLIRELMGVDLDERQLAVARFSSHLAFYILLGLILFVMVHDYFAIGKQPPPVWYLLLIAPLMVKFLWVLFENYGYLLGARLIGLFLSSVFILFVLLSHGFLTPEWIPFALLGMVAWFSRRWPRVAALVYFLLALGLTLLFHGWFKLPLYTRFIMYSLLPFPLLAGSWALWRGAIENQ